MPAGVNEKQAPGIDRARRYRGIRSVSRALHIVAAVLLLLVVGATLHQLTTLRSAIVDDTSQQMARLDMVFAEQTGRAMETVDFILRNTIETWQSEFEEGPVNPFTFDALLMRRIKGVRQVTELAITDESGKVILSSGQDVGTVL